MLLDTYWHGHEMAWGWVRWQCCDMPVLCQIIWLPCHRETNHISIHSFLLSHVFRKEYGLVSCNRFPGTHQVERPGWGFHGPGLKPVIRLGGMGVSGWDREGGTPLSARIEIWSHAIRGCGLPISKFFLDVVQGDSWHREVKWVCTS